MEINNNMNDRKIIPYKYRCIKNYRDQFTKNKIYYLRPGFSICDELAFIDNNGDPNGYYLNFIYFEPFYDDDNHLPEKWYIRGCWELSQYLNDNNIRAYYCGFIDWYGYYIINDGIWNSNSVNYLQDYQEINIHQYLNLINSKENGKK